DDTTAASTAEPPAASTEASTEVATEQSTGASSEESTDVSTSGDSQESSQAVSTPATSIAQADGENAAGKGLRMTINWSLNIQLGNFFGLFTLIWMAIINSLFNALVA
ncbi:MAG: hypothetical protein Q3976_09140, partial [Corynebacterium sp.]|nr:hypothetical protein [Corynebacterium sp.]